MSSFYGGKQGRTYNIVQRYDCVYLNPNNYPNRPQELLIGDIYKVGERVYCYLGKDENLQDKIYELKGMVNLFQKGGAYTEANYGEYVLIDTSLTTGKSNRENGLLYRRGFNFLELAIDRPKLSDAAYQKTVDNVTEFDLKKYQAAWINWARNPGGGAIYEGQIVGPEGKVPNVTVENWDAFLQQIDEGQGGYSTISMNSPGIVENEEGAETPYSYNDEIDVGYVNLMDATGDVVGAYLAFDIPTPVFNITAQSVDAYGNLTLNVYPIEDSSTASGTYNIGASTYLNGDGEVRWRYDNLIHVEPSSTAHSFFHNFDIAIPNGIHGQNITEIKVETATAGSTFSNANYNDVIDGDQYFTYTSKNYDLSAEGAETEHLGRWPYRVINEITTPSSTRTPSVELWTLGNSVVLGDIYKIPENLDGLYVLCIREGVIGLESSIPEDIVEGVLFLSGSSKWIALTLEEAAAASQLIVDYTAGDSQTFDYKQIDHMFIDDVGRLYAVFSTDLETPIYLGAIKQIDSITLDPDIRNPQIIKANYLAGSTTHISLDIGTLNNILDIQRVGDSIVVLYSDPAVRAAIPLANRYYMPWGGYYEQRSWTNIQGNIANSLIGSGLLFVYNLGLYIKIERFGVHDLSWVNSNISDWRNKLYQKIYTYDNLIWYNFGPLGTQYHVQGSYTFEDISLAGTSPIRNGLGTDEGTQNRQGWLITIQDWQLIPQLGDTPASTKEVQRVFAYDYARFAREDDPYTITTFSTPASTYSSYWHEIISLTDSVTPADSHIVVSLNIDSATSDDSIYQSRDNLKENGIWFEVTGGGCSHD